MPARTGQQGTNGQCVSRSRMTGLVSVLPIMGESILMEPMKELVKHGQAPNWVRVGQGIKWSIY